MLVGSLGRTAAGVLRLRGITAAVRWPALSVTGTRDYAKEGKRGRRKFVEAVVIKNTKSSKQVVEVCSKMTAQELATALQVSFDDLTDCVAKLDSTNFERAVEDKPLDDQTILKTAHAFGFKPKMVNRKVAREEVTDDLLPLPPAPDSECVRRPPVVTIMGHVDHGKTTLLDSLRSSKLTEGEFGGITQHIGAFSVELKETGRKVTFLDTPGHAAFAAMRARGAQGADIVVLVVAADDGVKEQTVQSIKFAQTSNVPMIVAVNKCDKPGADPMRAKRSLLEHGVVVEELGGDVQCVEISALYSKNIKALQEAIVLQADLMELRAPAKGPVEGVVVESSLLHGVGKVCTVIVTRGTLEKNDILVAGSSLCRIRAMTDENGRPLGKCTPSTPARVAGWKDELPVPGSIVLEAPSMDAAQRAVAYRERQKMQEKAAEDWEATEGKRNEEREAYMANRKILLDRGIRYGSTLRRIVHKKNRLERATDDGFPQLNIILKCDVEGTLEAIMEILESYNCEDQCKLSIVDFAVGAPTEKDVEIAKETSAVIYSFNVRTSPAVRSEAERNMVPLEQFNVIYRLVEALQNELSSRLPKKEELELIGEGHVLKEFLISDRARKRQPIAGCLVDWGNFKKNSVFKFSRGNKVVYEGDVESMKCDMEVVTNAKTNTEVGIALDNKNIRFETGDAIEVYERKQVEQRIQWSPAGF